MRGEYQRGPGASVQAFPTVQTRGHGASWGEAVELAPGVTSLPAPQPASLLDWEWLCSAPREFSPWCEGRTAGVSVCQARPTG